MVMLAGLILAGGKGYTPQLMAAMMYDSLHDKLLKLDNSVEVYSGAWRGLDVR